VYGIDAGEIDHGLDDAGIDLAGIGGPSISRRHGWREISGYTPEIEGLIPGMLLRGGADAAVQESPSKHRYQMTISNAHHGLGEKLA